MEGGGGGVVDLASATIFPSLIYKQGRQFFLQSKSSG